MTTTRNARSSAIFVGCPWRGQLPEPDVAAEDQGDRQQIWVQYRNILAGEAVIAPPVGGGAGSGGRRRQFPFPNRYDDAEIFNPPPKIPEKIPTYVEGDPAHTVEPVAKARVEGPTSLTDIGRQPLIKTPPAPSLPPRPVKAKVKRPLKGTSPDALDTDRTTKPDEVGLMSGDDLDARLERVMTKVLAKHRAESEPEDEEERELRLLRQLGFLH